LTADRITRRTWNAFALADALERLHRDPLLRSVSAKPAAAKWFEYDRRNLARLRAVHRCGTLTERTDARFPAHRQRSSIALLDSPDSLSSAHRWHPERLPLVRLFRFSPRSRSSGGNLISATDARSAKTCSYFTSICCRLTQYHDVMPLIAVALLEIVVIPLVLRLVVQVRQPLGSQIVRFRCRRRMLAAFSRSSSSRRCWHATLNQRSCDPDFAVLGRAVHHHHQRDPPERMLRQVI
jgi:hypothetical protein